MKRLFLALLLLPACTKPIPQEVTPQVQPQKKKLILYEFHASWCGYCHKMERTTLKDPKVLERLATLEVIVVDLDRDKELAKKYNITSVPTYILVENKEVRRITGYQSVESFLEFLE